MRIQTTAGEASTELQRRGINAAAPITITIADDFDALLTKARASSRPKVQAAGLIDRDVDDLIKQARAELAAAEA
jgi:hypothetical protein